MKDLSRALPPSGSPSTDAYWRAVIDAVSEGVVVQNAEGVIVACNPAAGAILGLSTAQILGRTSLDPAWHVVDEHGEPMPGEHHPAMVSLRTGEPCREVPMGVHLPDGELRWISVNAQPLLEAAGARPYAVVTSFRDVTEQRRQQAALRESEQRLRTVIEALPVGVWLADAQGRIVLGNPAGQAIWAGARYVGPDEYGQYVARWVETGTQIQAHEWGLSRALKGETSLGELIEIECFDGGRKTILNSALPLHDDEGRIVGAVAVNEDVTERRRDEEMRARLAAIVDSAHDAIIAKNLEGVISDWNAGAERLYGYRREEVIGRPISILFPEGRRAEGQWILETIRRGEKIEHLETERVRQNGEHVFISLTISPIRTASGHVIGAATIERDITERKRAEAKLREHAQQLARADRRKDEFLAVLGHELRNPLTPIRNAVELLKRQAGLPAEMRWTVGIIDRQLDQLTHLVDDLLDVSRIARGKLELKRQRLDLNELLPSVLEAVQPLMEARDHRLHVDLCPQPLPVYADPARLRQVIGNLLNNAAKYTDPGGRIRLATHREGAQALVSVSDNGIGIAPEFLDRVFDTFSQAGGEPRGGLGLGLTLVRRLVEGHGGSVRAFSAGPGKGSEFVVRLPLA